MRSVSGHQCSSTVLEYPFDAYDPRLLASAGAHLDRSRPMTHLSTRSWVDGGDVKRRGSAARCGPRSSRKKKCESGIGDPHESIRRTNQPKSASLPSRMIFVPTILHISDLHRTSGPHLSNDELLPALVSDAIRWQAEGIPRPDLIAVSGDLVQGAALNHPDPDAEVDAQYREVGDFLNGLSEEFLNADRSRLIIVPGNHDVHWRRSLDGMTPIEPCPDRIATKAFEATSGLRWNWAGRQAYEISNQDLYESRLEHFRRFRKAFYEGVEPTPLSLEEDDFLFIEYPELDLLVAGFSSWHGNDCFCHVGEIAQTSLATSQRCVARSQMQIAVAVWHHSIAGGPRSNDYMDQRIVHRLIDFGFTVGLHGHQHYPGAAPFELRLPNLTSMAVVGAGSLAVGDDELPMGERRQFNVVVIDPDSESITVHVRGMSAAGVFTGSHRDDFGGNTFIRLKLPASRSDGEPSSAWKPLDEAMTALAERRFEDAIELVEDVPPSRSTEKRSILIEALRALGRQGQLIELLNPPRNVDEVVELISLLLDNDRVDDAQNQLQTSESLLIPSLFDDLSATIRAREIPE